MRKKRIFRPQFINDIAFRKRSKTLQKGAMRDFAHTPTFSRYTIESTLGSGGMGTVYLAYHEILNRPVALKVPKRELASSDHFVERFLREAKALGTLHHRNIVTVYDAGIENDTPYIAMKYIAGETLSDIIRSNGQVELENVIRWGRQMADALAYLHDQQILHRDLKGANVIIDLSGDAIIADFGIAQIEADSNLTRGVLGTPAFMSPEQAMGKDLDARSDMHGLGVILYHSLTGELPFQDDNSLALIQKVIHETPRPVTEIRPETPKWLEDIVKKCLQKHPSHRFKDDRELIKAFDNGMTRPTRNVSLSFLPARRKLDLVKPETLKPQPSVRVLDVIRSKANTVYANFDGEQTITILDPQPKRLPFFKRLLQHGIFLSFAALLALILVAPLTFSKLSGTPPAEASEHAEEPHRPTALSSNQEQSTSEQDTQKPSGSTKKRKEFSLATLSRSNKSTSVDSTTIDSLNVPQPARPDSVLPQEEAQLSGLKGDSLPDSSLLSTLQAESLDSANTSETTHNIGPATRSPQIDTSELPETLLELLHTSTRRELVGLLEEFRKDNRIQYGNRKRVSQPDLAYIFLMNKSEDGMFAVLIPSQTGWTDVYSGDTITHEKGDFFIEGTDGKQKIENIDPIWMEVISIDSETPPAQLKRKVTGW